MPGLIAQFSKRDFWNLGIFLDRNRWTKKFRRKCFIEKNWSKKKVDNFSKHFRQIFENLSELFFWNIVNFFSINFFRWKIFDEKFYCSPIPIPNFPKIPKITLRKSCDEFKDTKSWKKQVFCTIPCNFEDLSILLRGATLNLNTADERWVLECLRT